MNTKGAFYAKWGLILGGGIAICKWLALLVGPSMMFGFLLGLIYYTIFFCIIYLLQKAYSKDYLGKYPNFGALFQSGFKTTMCASIIVFITMFLFFKYIIDESFIYSIQENFYQSMTPFITDENEEMIDSMTRTFFSPLSLSISDAIGFIFEGAFVTLITSLFLKKKDPNPFSEVE